MLLDLMEVSGENLALTPGGEGVERWGLGRGKDTSHWKILAEKGRFNGKKKINSKEEQNGMDFFRDLVELRLNIVSVWRKRDGTIEAGVISF